MSSHTLTHNLNILEAPENKKREEIELKIRNIIRESFSLLVQSPINRADVDAFCKNPDATNKTTIDIKIKKIIADKLGNDDYLNYNEKITEQLSDINKIKKMIIRDLAERQKSEKNFTNIICRWFSITDWTKKTHIENIAKQASTKDLQLFCISPKKAKQFLIKEGFDDANFSPTDLQDFLRDCHIDISNLQESEKNAIQFYLETQKPNSTLLEILLSHTTNNTEKLHIIEKVTGNIPFSILIQYQLINEAQQEDIIQKVYESSIDEEIRKNLTLPEEWEIKNLIWRDLEKNVYTLSIEDLSGIGVANALLTNNGFIASINSIFDEYAEMDEEENANEREKLSTLSEMKTFLKDSLSTIAKAKISGKDASGVNYWSADDAIDAIATDMYITLWSGDQKSVWKITKGDALGSSGKRGISFNVMDVTQDGSVCKWKSWSKNLLMSYGDFVEGITKNLNNVDIAELSISPFPPDVFMLNEAVNTTTLADFQATIDSIDPKNTGKPFEKDCVFALKFVDSKGKNRTEHIRVMDINESTNMLTIRTYDDQTMTVGWGEFVDVISSYNSIFFRLGQMNSASDFVHNAFIPKELYKSDDDSGMVNLIDPPMFMNGSTVSMKTKHPENGAEITVPVWGFKHPEKPAFLEAEFKDGVPVLTEIYYSSDQQEMEAGRLEEKNASKGKNDDDTKKLRKMKKRRTLSYNGIVTNYEWLMQVMIEKGYTMPVYGVDADGVPGGDVTPVEQHEKQLDEDERSALEGELPDNASFKKGGFWSRLSNATTIGDVVLMLKMVKGSIEQYFEKSGKLRSAESLHSLFSGVLGEDSTLARLALKEFTNEVWSLIEGKMDMIRRLKGKEMRAEIRKILLTKPPHPVDILAAAIVTAEMGGHMYPDSSLQELQWERYIWFEQICLAIGVDPHFEMRRCREKVAAANEGSAHHPSEEELITQLCKFNQSNKWIQAIGGGPKFWKKPAEWRGSQTEKGKKEAAEFSSPADRANYAVAKMASNEFEITLGAIEVVAWKSMAPKEMGIGFVWAASNAPNYVHKDTGNALRNIFYGGNVFHGFFFGKEKASGDLYKNIIDIALQRRVDLGLEDAEAMQAEYKKVTEWRDARPYAHSESLIKGLWDFWQKYQHILHPILQGTDPLLATIIQDDSIPTQQREKAKDYLVQFWENTMILFEKIQWPMRDNLSSINATYQLPNSFPLMMKEPPYRIFGSLLSNLSFDNVTKDMSGADRNGIWNPIVVDYLKYYVRDNEVFRANPEFQKKQFLILYKEVMAKLSEKMTIESENDFNSYVESGAYKHLQGLRELGFDVSHKSIYKSGWRKEFADNPDAVFARFKNSAGTSGSQLIQNRIQARFWNISLSGAENDDKFQEVA